MHKSFHRLGAVSRAFIPLPAALHFIAPKLQRSPSLQRFAKLRELLEANFTGWHQVAPYAKALGCTQKSINRATQDAAGLSAKDFIARRVALEAKRLLAHTDKPIYLIAEDLGFDEATNFSKFFRQHAGQAPAEFRAVYRRTIN